METALHVRLTCWQESRKGTIRLDNLVVLCSCLLAFLNGLLDDEEAIYMEQSPDFEIADRTMSYFARPFTVYARALASDMRFQAQTPKRQIALAVGYRRACTP
jgi:hypothetical protein